MRASRSPDQPGSVKTQLDGERKSLDDNFRDWETTAFGFGYGTGEPHIIPALKAFMDTLEDRRSYDYRAVEERHGPLAAWLLINALCHADILEYGTSPRFGWLTAKGEALRDYVAGRSAEELLTVLDYDENYYPCYPDSCNCGPDGYEEGRVCPNPFWGR